MQCFWFVPIYKLTFETFVNQHYQYDVHSHSVVNNRPTTTNTQNIEMLEQINLHNKFQQGLKKLLARRLYEKNNRNIQMISMQ